MAIKKSQPESSSQMRIAFIGGGNMASALIKGLKQASRTAPMIVIDPSPQVQENFAHDATITLHGAPHADLRLCDVIVLAVKPQQLQQVARSLVAYLTQQLIVSVAAGIRSQDLMRWLGGYKTVVRCMPNTPALIGAGITGLYAPPQLGQAQRGIAQDLVASVGQTLWVDSEDLLDAVTAISGSGPAYVFYFIEALEQAALELGLAPAAARQLALHTFLGAAQLASQSPEAPSVLRARVTSKGGTTDAALTSMAHDHIDQAVLRAAQAAAKRSAELGDALAKAD